MRAKAVVITPAYSHAHHGLHLQLMRSGLPWLPRYEHSDLPRVRSVLIEEALATLAPRIILVDADNVPADGVLMRLAEHPLVTPTSAVWGLYPLREGDRWSVRPEDPAAASAAIDGGQTFPILSGGLGLACVHRESLLRLADELPLIEEDTGMRWHPFCVPFVHDATYYADDGSFCSRLIQSGTRLVCDPKMRAAHAVSRLLLGVEPSARQPSANAAQARRVDDGAVAAPSAERPQGRYVVAPEHVSELVQDGTRRVGGAGVDPDVVAAPAGDPGALPPVGSGNVVG